MTSRHEHDPLPFWIYFAVAGALFVLTIVTVAVAQYDFGEMNIIVAMAIAATKGSLVALFFMHLKYDNKLYASFFVGSLVFLATFIIFTMIDTETRGRVYQDVEHPISNRAVIYGDDNLPLKKAGHGGETHGEEGEAHSDSLATPGASPGHASEKAVPAEDRAPMTDEHNTDSDNGDPSPGNGH